MTYPPGGDPGPYRDTPDYPTQQFRPVQADPPAAQYPPADYRQDPYGQERYGQAEREQDRPDRDRDYRDRDYRERDAAKRRLPWVWLIVVAIVLVAAAGAGGYVVGHSRGKKDGRGTGPTHFLSHTAVEGYIAQHFGAANVQCYGGQDMPLSANSAFTCTAAGTSFVVIVENPATGTYQVVKTS